MFGRGNQNQKRKQNSADSTDEYLSPSGHVAIVVAGQHDSVRARQHEHERQTERQCHQAFNGVLVDKDCQKDLRDTKKTINKF